MGFSGGPELVSHRGATVCGATVCFTVTALTAGQFGPQPWKRYKRI